MMGKTALSMLLVLIGARFAYAADATQTIQSGLNLTALVSFLVFAVSTLGISFWASKRTKSSATFYNAGGNISAAQNGTAIAGDFMSAASFLGISGLIYLGGFDAFVVAIGALAGWPIMLFLMSERVRNLGRFTITDVVSYRLQKDPIKTIASIGSLSVVIFYLIAQMVGAGKLVELLLGVSYEVSVILVAVLVIVYVAAGGMLATTWVQIIKAILLLFGALMMCFITLFVFNFDINSLFEKAVSVHPKGADILRPGSFFSSPVQAITIAVSMMCGTLGLPHILMRLFTVKDMHAARRSVFYASGFMGLFYLMIILIGFATIAFLAGNPDYEINGKLIGGSNLAAVHLSHALGGNVLVGFMSAVAFSTILAVVAGLTVAGSAVISHDIYAGMLAKGETNSKKELLISRLSVVVLCLLGVALGILFQHQNVAFIAVMPMVISASVNFPILILSMYWRGLTTRGAVVGGIVGFVSSITLIILGPKVWVSIIGAEKALFPYDYPGLFTMTAAFATIAIVSLLDRSPRAEIDRQMFDKQVLASEGRP